MPRTAITISKTAKTAQPKASRKTKTQAKAAKTQRKAAAPPPQQPKASVLGSVIPADFRKKYGKASNNGDAIALALNGCDLAEVAAANGVDLGRWPTANSGMVRMNLGNVLRGMVRQGKQVKIGASLFNQPAANG